MPETTKVIENIDKLFSEIKVNNESFIASGKAVEKRRKRTAPKVETVAVPLKAEAVEEPAETVKTIESIDRLFSEIEVNGETFTSDKVIEKPITRKRRTPPKIVKTVEAEPSLMRAVPYAVPQYGENVKAVDLNGTVHNFEDELAHISVNEVNTRLNTEIKDRENEDSSLYTYINSLQSAIDELQGKLDALKELVPEQASDTNQLADKNFVNSSIATNTANFIGTFTSLEELESQTATNNDYAFFETVDSDGNKLYKRYKYVADDETWQYEYDLNNSSFTAEQWEALNSGVTASRLDSLAPLDQVVLKTSTKFTETQTITHLGGGSPLKVAVENSATGFCGIAYSANGVSLGTIGVNKNKKPVFGVQQ